MAKKREEDHELITFKLKRIDKLFVWYSIISVVATIIFFPYITTFDGVWIMGMPKSAFFLVIVGVINALIALTSYCAYRRYFAKLQEPGGGVNSK